MILKAAIYGIDATDIRLVARVIEKTFGIAFEEEFDSEMGGAYFVYEPDTSVYEIWYLQLTVPIEDEAGVPPVSWTVMG